MDDCGNTRYLSSYLLAEIRIWTKMDSTQQIVVLKKKA